MALGRDGFPSAIRASLAVALACACVAPTATTEGHPDWGGKAGRDEGGRLRVQWVTLERPRNTGDLEADLRETYPAIDVVDFDELMGRARAQGGVNRKDLAGIGGNGQYALPALLSFFFVGTAGTTSGTAAGVASGTAAAGLGAKVLGLGLAFSLGWTAAEVLTVEPPPENPQAFEAFEVEGHPEDLALGAQAAPAGWDDPLKPVIGPPLAMVALWTTLTTWLGKRMWSKAEPGVPAPEQLRIVFLDFDDATLARLGQPSEKRIVQLMAQAQAIASRAAITVHDHIESLRALVRPDIGGRYLKTLTDAAMPIVIGISFEDQNWPVLERAMQALEQLPALSGKVQFGHLHGDPVIHPTGNGYSYMLLPLKQKQIPSVAITAYGAYLSVAGDCDADAGYHVASAVAQRVAETVRIEGGKAHGIRLGPDDVPGPPALRHESMLPLVAGTGGAKAALRSATEGAIVIIGATHRKPGGSSDVSKAFKTEKKYPGSVVLGAAIHKLWLHHGGAGCHLADPN